MKKEPCDKLYRLHLRLRMELDAEEEKTLKKYGKVKKELSRDLAVPSDITLHALHFAIQQAFGWRNSHLHRFTLDQPFTSDRTAKLTGDRLEQYGALCGRYFRAPYSIDDEKTAQDIYWDDDYKDDLDPKAWMRSKYTGPYFYGGSLEHYLVAHSWNKECEKKNPNVRVPQSFQEYLANKGKPTEPAIKPLGDLTIDEAHRLFECSIGELLERLRLDEVLATGRPVPSALTLPVIPADTEAKFPGMMEEYRSLMRKNEEYERLMRKRGKLTRREKEFLLAEQDPYPLLQEKEQALDKLLEETDGRVEPLTDTLYYAYDYGDGWEVDITCTDVYTLEKDASGEQTVKNMQELPISEKEREQILRAAGKHTVKCLAVDGIGLLDDVGGVFGYLELLELAAHPDEDEEDKVEWAESWGWKCRVPAASTLM